MNALGPAAARDAVDGIDLVALLQKTFADAQVPLHWLSRDRGTKADAVLDHGGVALSTVHFVDANAIVVIAVTRFHRHPTSWTKRR